MIIDYREINANEWGLPPWLMERLEDCPAAGEGVHSWIYKTLLALRHYVEIDEGVSIVQECMTRPESPYGEVSRSAENAYNAEYSGLPDEAYSQSSIPAANPDAVERIYRAYKGKALDTLRNASQPIPCLVEILNRLYSDNDYVCIGNANLDERGVKWGYRSTTLQKKLLVTAEDLDAYSQIVPNPMRKEWGFTKAGKESERSLENAAINRTYAVTDFDLAPEGRFGELIQREMHRLSLMSQYVIHEITAALILEIAQRSPDVPLLMVVDSGGKSLHAWWDVRHLTLAEQKAWFYPWVPLGADHTLFDSNNQFARMPHGTREKNYVRQPVIFWGL